MSKMSDLVLDIQYLLERKQSPAQIARELEIPISWVYEAQTIQAEAPDEMGEILSPYATINS